MPTRKKKYNIPTPAQYQKPQVVENMAMQFAINLVNYTPYQATSAKPLPPVVGTGWNTEFLKDAFKSMGPQMADAAAAYFSVNFIFIKQSGPIAGLNTIAVRRISDGKVFISSSGTQPNGGWTNARLTFTTDGQLAASLTAIPGTPAYTTFHNESTGMVGFVKSLETDFGVQRDKVILTGHSLGGAVALWAAKILGIKSENVYTQQSPSLGGIGSAVFYGMTLGAFNKVSEDANQNIVIGADIVPWAGAGTKNLSLGSTGGLLIKGHLVGRNNVFDIVQFQDAVTLLKNIKLLPANFNTNVVDFNITALAVTKGLTTVGTPTGPVNTWVENIGGTNYQVTRTGGIVGGLATIQSGSSENDVVT